MGVGLRRFGWCCFFPLPLTPPPPPPTSLPLSTCGALTEALSGKTEQSDNAASLPRTLSEPKREQREECATEKWQNKQKSRRQSAAKVGDPLNYAGEGWGGLSDEFHRCVSVCVFEEMDKEEVSVLCFFPAVPSTPGSPRRPAAL